MLNRKTKEIAKLEKRLEWQERDYSRFVDRQVGYDTSLAAADLFDGLAEALERKSRKLRINSGFDLERRNAMVARADEWRKKARAMRILVYGYEKGPSTEHLHIILKRHLAYRTPKKR